MKFRAWPVVSLIALGLLPSCGGGGSDSPAAPPPPPPTTLPAVGQYAISVTPSPVLATPSGNPDFPWHAQWEVTIRDIAGLEGDVNRVVTTARNNFGFTFVWSDFNPAEFIEGIGTNHIPTRGTLVFRDDGDYFADGNGGQQLTLTIAAEVIDARGNHSNISTDVRITHTEHARLK